LTRALPEDGNMRSLNTVSSENTLVPPVSVRSRASTSAPPAAEASQRRSGSRTFLEDLGIVMPTSTSMVGGLGRSQALHHSQTRPQPQAQYQARTRAHTHILPAYRTSSDITLAEDVELQDVGGLLSRLHQNQS
jgi:hypothetical protein